MAHCVVPRAQELGTLSESYDRLNRRVSSWAPSEYHCFLFQELPAQRSVTSNRNTTLSHRHSTTSSISPYDSRAVSGVQPKVDWGLFPVSTRTYIGKYPPVRRARSADRFGERMIICLQNHGSRQKAQFLTLRNITRCWETVSVDGPDKGLGTQRERLF